MRLLATASLLALTLAGCAHTADQAPPAAPAVVAAPTPRQIPTQLPTNVRPVQYGILIQPDAAKLRFKGSVLIHIQVLEATDEIVMNAADLDIGSAQLISGINDEVEASRITLDEERQLVRIRFAKPIAPGSHRLNIEYDGKIYTQAAGLFALDYDGPEGKKRALFTQFEAPDARRFFPGWDEPQFRTPYTPSTSPSRPARMRSATCRRRASSSFRTAAG
jgi:aminopeptidase N